MSFENIVGQSEIIQSLKSGFVSGRAGHALIFSGPSGIGKKTVARAYAQLLLCSESSGSSECGKCNSCLLFGQGAHPDYRELEPEGQSIGVDAIRDLQSDASVKPMYSGRKVYIIAEAETMTVQAQNCLLKVLEEPPPYLVFILTASNYDALLETIRSRGVKYSFRRNTRNEVAEWVRNNISSKAGEAELISALSEGIIGRAFELCSSEEFSSIRGKAVQLALSITGSDPEYVFESTRYLDENKAAADTILNIMLLMYRDIMVYLETGNTNILINSDKKDIILRNAARYTVPQLLKFTEIIETSRRNIKRNINYQLSTEVMLMKLQEDCINGKGGWGKV